MDTIIRLVQEEPELSAIFALMVLCVIADTYVAYRNPGEVDNNHMTMVRSYQ
jgi:hypothetical protein